MAKEYEDMETLANDLLKGHYLNSDELLNTLVPIAYLHLEENKEEGNKNENLIKDAKYLERFQSPNSVNYIRSIISSLSNEDIKQLILILLDKTERYYSGHTAYEESGSSISSLIYSLLDIKDEDSIFDLGSGNGSTLLEIYQLAKDKNIKLKELSGIEINSSGAILSRLILAILTDDQVQINIDNNDALINQPFTYSKGYVYPPIGQHQLFRSRDIHCLMYPEIRFGVSFYEQWIFVDRLLYGLNGDNKRAVALLFGKSLMQTNNNSFLQRLVKDGWIEGIIEIPHGVLPGVGVTPYLFIFSEHNENIKFVYASRNETTTPIYNSRNTQIVARNLLTDKVVELYSGEDNDNKKTLSIEEALKLRCFIPANVFETLKSDDSSSYTPLNKLAKIDVGSQYTIALFERSKEATPYRVLTSSDIEDGLINWDNLAYVKLDREPRERTLAHKGDVIVTTKSTKVKTAVVDIEPTDNVIVTGGMIIVRPNPDKLDSTYLKMFLDSDEGIQALKVRQTGTTIIHISPSMFSTLGIPNVDLETQKKKADKYNNKLATIAAYRERIAKLEDEIGHIIVEDEDVD